MKDNRSKRAKPSSSRPSSFEGGAGVRPVLLLLLGFASLSGCMFTAHSIRENAAGPHPAISRQPASTSIKFVDVTQKAGIDFVATNSKTSNKYMVETMGSGCAFIDYDNDGYLDILLLNGAPLPGGKVSGRPTSRLYHNNHDGTFTDVTHKAGLDKVMYAMGCAVGDYDNDGYDDLYITCALGPSHLFHNNGNGTFTDVTQRAGVANEGMWGTSCAWVDVDNDGYLDLFVCNYVLYRSLKDDTPCYVRSGQRTYCVPTAFKESHCVLYHNNHDGTFTDISHSAGIDKPGKSLGVAVWDYDHDGRPDIFVANDTTPSFLFHNLGHNRFEEVGVVSGIATDEIGNSHSGMGIDVADLYNDSKCSVVITNYSKQETSLYDEASSGIFRDNKATDGIGPPSVNTLGFGAGFLDVDNAGYKDLFVLNGHVQDNIDLQEPGVRYAESPFLYYNDHNGRFHEAGIASGTPFDVPIVGRGLAWGDYDNDGKIDLLITTSGGPAYLWRNTTPTSNHWLKLKLIGTKSNRDGIGAVVTVRADGQTQIDAVRSGSSYLSASDLRASFGLGGATSAEIEVKWPSGTVDHIPAASADLIWKLVEGSGTIK